MGITELIGNNQTDKHQFYKDKYPFDTIFWGLGIENELYLEFEKYKLIDKKILILNHKRERYSVDYYSSYSTELLDKAFKYLDNKIDVNYLCPILLNSHSFTKTDKNNNSKTTYEKIPKPNKKFQDKTLQETLEEHDDYFKSNSSNHWIFDGDTIEFLTLNFVNPKLYNVIKELNTNKHLFISKINNIFESEQIFKEYGKINFMKKNHPFAIYMTNLNNVNMFNNGTLHFNITLPTKLDSSGNIENKQNFIQIHKEAIKIIQWLEPLIITVYGSADPFSLCDNFEYKKLFSLVSQRCAVSRYIGIGTYDTNKMTPGKILTIPIETHPHYSKNNWWFNKYYTNCAYNKLKEIGLDINFNKHYAHGIEIRFFDYINQNDKLYESFEFIIYLMDIILDLNENNEKKNITNPITNDLWNELTFGIMSLGQEYNIKDEIIIFLNDILDIKIEPSVSVIQVYYQIYWQLKIKFNEIKFNNSSIGQQNNSGYLTTFIPKGKFSKLCLSQQQINIKNKYIDDFINREIIKNTLETNLNTNYGCNNCCVIC